MSIRFSVLKLSAALALSLITTGAYAASYSFNYEALASNQFQAVSGDFGSNINIGDSVTFTLTTSAGNVFSASMGDSMFAILGLDSVGGGVRYSDYSWRFLQQGTEVGNGSSLNESTSSIHMGPLASINFNGLFDTYVWTATLNSSTTGTNIATDIGYNAAPMPLYGGTWQYGITSAQFMAATVPEPESYALFLAGLACFGLFARQKKS